MTIKKIENIYLTTNRPRAAGLLVLNAKYAKNAKYVRRGYKNHNEILRDFATFAFHIFDTLRAETGL